MSIDPKYVIKQASEALQDPTFVRWTVPELVRYFNDGCREVLVSRPDATAKNVTLTLTQGAKQTLQAGFVKLLDLRRNTTGSRAITQCPMEVLDAVDPDWAGRTPSGTIIHFMFDPRTPREFHVYPPAVAGTQVHALCAELPTQITEPVGATDIEGVVDVSNLPEVMTNALVNYLLFRAYAKDSETASNAQRASAYYDAFAKGLGTEVAATVTVGPTSKPTPLSSS